MLRKVQVSPAVVILRIVGARDQMRCSPSIPTSRLGAASIIQGVHRITYLSIV